MGYIDYSITNDFNGSYGSYDNLHTLLATLSVYNIISFSVGDTEFPDRIRFIYYVDTIDVAAVNQAVYNFVHPV